MEFFQSFENPEFWVGLLKIIWINILLSGDNCGDRTGCTWLAT